MTCVKWLLDRDRPRRASAAPRGSARAAPPGARVVMQICSIYRRIVWWYWGARGGGAFTESCSTTTQPAHSPLAISCECDDGVVSTTTQPTNFQRADFENSEPLWLP
jgi:hypothetical protein